jgi:hypothetical protein
MISNQLLKTEFLSDNFDDVDLPSYQCQNYRQMLPKLIFVADMYRGRSAWYSPNQLGFTNIIDTLKAVQYLPQETDESTEDYVTRLSRSYFQRFFRNTIQGFVGFLSSFTLIKDNIHQTFLDRY